MFVCALFKSRSGKNQGSHCQTIIMKILSSFFWIVSKIKSTQVKVVFFYTCFLSSRNNLGRIIPPDTSGKEGSLNHFDVRNEDNDATLNWQMFSMLCS